jgi:UDP-N-acetylglucosamine 1-carboxyvinyltransferase
VPRERFLVEGGHRLEGSVRVSGSKNAAVHALAATLLTAEDCCLENLPAIDDVRSMSEILGELGVQIERLSPSSVRVNAADIRTFAAPSQLAVSLRASFLVMGPLLARFGQAACCPPGGDVIGLRPLDVHLSGFAALGADVEREGDKFVARAPRLHGGRIFMDYPSVLGTQNLMLAASLAQGTTVIVNAAAEPEIATLGEMLNRMGARICGAGSHTVEIEGVDELHGASHHILPDRIEAGTFVIAAAITEGEVEIREGNARHLDALIWKLAQAGVEVDEVDGGVLVRRRGPLRAVNAQAVPYPGLATDLQAPLAVLLTQAHGVSFIYERVFDNRLLYVGELRKMGAEMVTSGTTAVISGPTPLRGTNVRALDVRAGAALVLAALAAEGRTEISDIYHLDRGYEDLDGKLRALGAVIERA